MNSCTSCHDHDEFIETKFMNEFSTVYPQNRSEKFIIAGCCLNWPCGWRFSLWLDEAVGAGSW